MGVDVSFLGRSRPGKARVVQGEEVVGAGRDVSSYKEEE